MLNLHRQVEQDLNKKLHLLEKTKTKEDVNYEYIKNIFTKYIVFTAHGSAAEAKQMESFLFDLLHYTKEEKENLEKSRRTKGGFLGIFGSGAGTKASIPGITGTYVVPSGPTGRSQSVQRPSARSKASTETSFYKDQGDFSGISSTNMNFHNMGGLRYKK